MPVPPFRLASQFVLDRFVGAVLRHHPHLEASLSSLAGARIAIDPTDLPLAFLLDCAGARPRLTLRRAVGLDDADAVIRGTLLTLLDLCDGRLDGDAAFFARRLSFDGSAAMVVALRNVLDGADIDLRRDIRRRVESLPGPLRRFAVSGIEAASRACAWKRHREQGETA